MASWVEPDEAFLNDPFARAAERMRKATFRPSLPIEGMEKPYVMDQDLLQAQQGTASLPPGVALNDAGIPFNIQTGEEVPTVRRPSVLPIARTPDGLTFAMPKMLDAFGNIMGNVGGVAKVAAKPGEMVLGSGLVKPTVETAKAVESGPFFSGLERAVEGAKVGKADASTWIGYLKNQPGVKAEELSYVLKDLPEGPITKEALADIVKGNKVSLDEVVKGGRTTLNELERKELLELADLGKNRTEQQELKYNSLRKIEYGGQPQTKYHDYQLPVWCQSLCTSSK